MKKLCLVVVLCFLASVAFAEYVPKVVELNYLERLMVLQLLPKEASYIEWKILNDIKLQLSPTEEEIKAVDMKPADNGGVIANWDAVIKEITFGEVSEKWVVDALNNLDRQKKLIPEQLSLYEKFIVTKKE